MELKERIGKKGSNPKLFLALLFAAILLASIVLTASAEGWNSRRAINITNNGGSDLTDYQVLVTLNYSNFDYSRANPDGSDLRFTNYSNAVPYHYWIETWNTSGESRIWVKIPSIPVWDGEGEVPSANRMYMLYNNSAASSESDGDSTFEFFDDFEADLSKWHKYGSPHSFIDSNIGGHTNALKLNGDGRYESGVYSEEIFSPPLCFEFQYYWDDYNPDDRHSFCGILGSHPAEGDRYASGSDEDYAVQRKYRNDTGLRFIDPSGCTNATQPYEEWANIMFCIDADGSDKMYLSGVLIRESGPNSYTPNAINLRSHDPNYWVDTVRVRKYASPEPITEVSATEEEAAPTTAIIFDTGQPENPYPSLMGTHNGTLRLNYTLNVSRMYTYPCEGTGGHSEYATFYYPNGTQLANGSWNGYPYDYHYIEFEEPFVLQRGVTYNYTIRTGSYPQIHHTQSVTNENGTITCTEFVDANGKRYDDWIPAIRLEGVIVYPPTVVVNVSATSPHVAAGDDDLSIVTVTAKDDFGNPVVGADIVLIKKIDEDEVEFETWDNADGTYDGFVSSIIPGEATLIARDRKTGVEAETKVIFTRNLKAFEINEVMFESSNDTGAWVEIYNKGNTIQTTENLTITNINHSFAYNIPAITMIPFSYVVIHFEEGVDDRDTLDDGEAHLFTGEVGSVFGDEDAVGLYVGDIIESSNLMDFVTWGCFSMPGGITFSHAVSAGIWSPDDFVGLWFIVEPGYTLARDPFSTDTNASEDWFPNGIGANAPTPGKVNDQLAERRTLVGFVEDEEGNPIEGAKVTIEELDKNGKSRGTKQVVTTDEDGSFNVSDLRPPFTRVNASMEGHIPTWKIVQISNNFRAFVFIQLATAPTGTTVTIGADGGTITINGVKIEVPPGALTENKSFTIKVKPLDITSLPSDMKDFKDHSFFQTGLTLSGFKISTDPKIEFLKKVKVTMPLNYVNNSSVIKLQTGRKLSYQVFDEEKLKWVEIAKAQIEPDGRNITVEIDHFSNHRLKWWPDAKISKEGRKTGWCSSVLSKDFTEDRLLRKIGATTDVDDDGKTDLSDALSAEYVPTVYCNETGTITISDEQVKEMAQEVANRFTSEIEASLDVGWGPLSTNIKGKLGADNIEKSFAKTIKSFKVKAEGPHTAPECYDDTLAFFVIYIEYKLYKSVPATEEEFRNEEGVHVRFIVDEKYLYYKEIQERRILVPKFATAKWITSKEMCDNPSCGIR